MVRFPTERMRGGHLFALLPAPGLGGRGHRLEQWVPAPLGKVIPMRDAAALSGGGRDRSDSDGDAA